MFGKWHIKGAQVLVHYTAARAQPITESLTIVDFCLKDWANTETQMEDGPHLMIE